jgi:DNA gyrase/topoisomerase IV subunit A
VSDRTGLGIVDVAVLEALHRIEARHHRPACKSARAVAELDAQYGLAPDLAYSALCDMARPWVVHLRCVDFHGNFGSPDFPAAAPQYTEARLSPLGALAPAAERGEVGAVPIGFINGNTAGGGTRPPFSPRHIVGALREVIANPAATDSELAGLAGGPVFPTGCEVTGNIQALVAGESVTLRLSARLRPLEGPKRGWVATRLPPGVGSLEVSGYVAAAVQRRPWSADLPELDRRTRIPVSSIDDLSDSETRLVFIASTGADPEQLRRQLSAVYGLTVEVRAQLPAPLPDTLRGWVTAHAADDITGSLSQLEQLLD